MIRLLINQHEPLGILFAPVVLVIMKVMSIVSSEKYSSLNKLII